jgi:hypothetical protein
VVWTTNDIYDAWRASPERAVAMSGAEAHIRSHIRLWRAEDHQLAGMVGASRERATDILEEYARRGLIRLAHGRIMVLDKAALRRAAGDD